MTEDKHQPERGHLMPNQLVTCFIDSLITGCAVVNVGLWSSGSIPTAETLVLTSLAAAAGEASREALDEQVYEHELAREVWEHKMSPFMEVQEFVDYAEPLGVPEAEATEIGRRMVQYPQLSVPYHLAIEIGMIKSRSHGQLMSKFVARSAGFLAGGAVSCLGLISTNKLQQSLRLTTITLLLTLPVLGLRYRNVSRLSNSARLYLMSGLGFATLLGLASVRWT